MLGKSGLWWFTTLIGASNAAGAAVLSTAALQEISLGAWEILGLGAWVAFTGYILGQTHSAGNGATK
jgi:hypothetical protein